nr:MAG TPA: hypothetical protein [Caudoviricetes sp.]
MGDNIIEGNASTEEKIRGRTDEVGRREGVKRLR